LDKQVKTNLIADTFRLLDVSVKTKQAMMRVDPKKRIIEGFGKVKHISQMDNEKSKRKHDLYEEEHLGGYTKIYP
jgi:hypothetical protein